MRSFQSALRTLAPRANVCALAHSRRGSVARPDSGAYGIDPTGKCRRMSATIGEPSRVSQRDPSMPLLRRATDICGSARKRGWCVSMAGISDSSRTIQAVYIASVLGLTADDHGGLWIRLQEISWCATATAYSSGPRPTLTPILALKPWPSETGRISGLEDAGRHFLQRHRFSISLPPPPDYPGLP